MASTLYSTIGWRRARRAAIGRDDGQCTVSRLLGGDCSHGRPSVHHVRPVEDGGAELALENLATVCSAHHPAWEALRRSLLRAQVEPVDEPPVCRHNHPTREARELCNARLRRRWERAQLDRAA